MKKVLLVFCLAVLFSVASKAQSVRKGDVPPAVLKSYLSQNSKGTTDSVWSKETVTIFKVDYMDEGKRYEAQYFDDGKWIKTFTQLQHNELPTTITSQLPQLYPGYAVEKSFIELNNDGKFYALDLTKGKDRITIYFYMSGKFVR